MNHFTSSDRSFDNQLACTLEISFQILQISAISYRIFLNATSQTQPSVRDSCSLCIQKNRDVNYGRILINRIMMSCFSAGKRRVHILNHRKVWIDAYNENYETFSLSLAFLHHLCRIRHLHHHLRALKQCTTITTVDIFIMKLIYTWKVCNTTHPQTRRRLRRRTRKLFTACGRTRFLQPETQPAASSLTLLSRQWFDTIHVNDAQRRLNNSRSHRRAGVNLFVFGATPRVHESNADKCCVHF